jgi:hypothetical protein
MISSLTTQLCQLGPVQVVVEAMSLTYTREDLYSNLGLETDYPD